MIPLIREEGWCWYFGHVYAIMLGMDDASKVHFDYILVIFLSIIIIIVPLCLTVGILTWIERKLIASAQKRKGPNRVGVFGFLQPLADGLKLFIKEYVRPFRSAFFLFMISPIISFASALLSFAVIPFYPWTEAMEIELPILLIMGIGLMNVYSIILAGWAGNSRLSFFGAIRAAALLIAYDLILSIVLIDAAFFSKTLSIGYIVAIQVMPGIFYMWNIVMSCLNCLLFFIVMIAELKRIPFDLPESESELVSGYSTEHGGCSFMFFFISEYAHIIFYSHIFVIVFLASWEMPGYYSLFFLDNFPGCFADKESIFWFFYYIKVTLVSWFIILLRVGFVRFRYDWVMSFSWTWLLSFALTFLLIDIIVWVCDICFM